jgi:hypothetical protein
MPVSSVLSTQTQRLCKDKQTMVWLTWGPNFHISPNTRTSYSEITKLWRACPKSHAGRFPWHAAFTAVPIYFLYLLLDQRLCGVNNICIYTHIWLRRDCITNYLCYQIIQRVKHLYTIRSGAKCWLDIYHWGASLAVNGRIGDIRQNVMKSLQTGSSSKPSCFHIFFLIAFLEEAFSRNIIIVLYINYIIIIFNNNNNNSLIKNNYRTIQVLILFFKIPMGTRKDFFEIDRTFGHAPSKRFASPVIMFLQRISEMLFFVPSCEQGKMV